MPASPGTTVAESATLVTARSAEVATGTVLVVELLPGVGSAVTEATLDGIGDGRIGERRVEQTGDR